MLGVATGKPNGIGMGMLEAGCEMFAVLGGGAVLRYMPRLGGGAEEPLLESTGGGGDEL